MAADRSSRRPARPRASSRRLARLHGHLASSARAASDAQAALEQLLPVPLPEGQALSASGWMQPDTSTLHSAIGAAAADGEFRLAAQLKDIAFVAEPQAPLTPADCAPPDPDDAAAFFVQNG